MNSLIEEPPTETPTEALVDDTAPPEDSPLEAGPDDDDDDDDSEVEPSDNGTTAPKKNKGGRPKGLTKEVLAAKRAAEEEEKYQRTKRNEPEEKPKLGRPPGKKVNPTKKFWNLIGIGSFVLWFRDGTRNALPYAAIVTGKHPEGLTLDITVFAPNRTTLDRYENGVRHIDDPDNNAHQMREIGAYDLTEESKALLALVDDDV